MVGDVRGIVFDEMAEHPVEIVRPDGAAAQIEPRLDHLAGAAADHVAPLVVGHGRQLLAREHGVHGFDQVRCGLDQRAVEVEYDGQGHVRVKAMFALCSGHERGYTSGRFQMQFQVRFSGKASVHGH